MYRCLIVADDLTGANASGVLLRPFGVRPITLAGREASGAAAPAAGLEGMDAAIVSTDSRGLSRDLAYARVRDATLAYKDRGVLLYTKRIDSTLRGNVGAEIDAMLDALAGGEGDERYAAVVPAYPQAGRVVAGGYLLVNGVPLERSDAARDPKAPVSTSVAADVVARQARRAAVHIPLAAVYAGASSLARGIRDAYARGGRMLVFDAVQPEDLDTIAEAVLAAGLPFIAADPGPFTASLAGRLLGSGGKPDRPRILLVVGSVVETAVLQLKELHKSYGQAPVFLDPARLLDGGEAEKEISRAVRALAASSERTEFPCVTTNGLDSASLLDLESIARARSSDRDEVSKIINEGIASVVEGVLEKVPGIGGLYLSGGDTTLAILRRFGAAGLALEREVLPLAAYGRIVGGRLSGMPVVTKGGMVGDRDAIKTCARFLRDETAGSGSRSGSSRSEGGPSPRKGRE